jgi:TFIIF-interacting CTD phosphatase-like protein
MSCKLNVILDLDNTLISSLDPKEFKTHKNNCRGLKYTQMKNYFYIFHRPYLQEFLDYLFDNFNVSVWTAGTKDYGTFIVKHIILNPQPYEDDSVPKNRPERVLKLILHSKNCDQSEYLYKTPTPKDLRYIYNFPGFNENNTFIVDDLQEVKDVNKNNVIQIKYFDAKNSQCVNDNELKNIIKKLNKILHN